LWPRTSPRRPSSGPGGTGRPTTPGGGRWRPGCCGSPGTWPSTPSVCADGRDGPRRTGGRAAAERGVGGGRGGDRGDGLRRPGGAAEPPGGAGPGAAAGHLLRADGGRDRPRRRDPARNGEDAHPARAAARPGIAGRPGRGGVTVDWSDEELAEVADELLLAVPPVEPPAGFEDRVMERIHGTRHHRSGARAPWWAVAAAAIAFLFAGGVVGAVIGRSSGNDHEALRTVQLISTSGADIGDVSKYSGKPNWIFM